jgi:hypothetical protein
MMKINLIGGRKVIFSKIPKDVEEIFDQLPQHVLAEIQIQMMIFSGLQAIKLAQQPNRQERKRYIRKNENEYLRLIREAQVKQ